VLESRDETVLWRCAIYVWAWCSICGLELFVFNEVWLFMG